MAVRNLRSTQPSIWIPPIYTANWRVTVERLDGTIDDITDIIMDLKIDDGVTEGIGIFEFKIPNPNETYTSVWTGMEIFRYYSDYATSATTLRFRGRIEKASNQNNELMVTGRSETLFVQDQDISQTYDTQDAGYIVKHLFDTYGQGRFDTTSINTSTGITLTLTFINIPFWDAITAVCTAAGYDCYVASDLVVKFFVQGSVINTAEAIVHDYNLIEVGDFAPDLQFIKNKIRVIGGDVDGVQVTYTANDTASQTAYGIRKATIQDDGITTMDAAKDLAEFELSNQKNPPTVGDMKGILLASIQPGDSIRLSSPSENIPPGNYRTIKYTHEISTDGLFTTVTINKEPRRVSHVLKQRIQRENKMTDGAGNPSDLDFAEIELFNSSIGTNNNTVISNGVLAVSAGNSNGTWTSPTYNTQNSNNVNRMRISVVGDNIPNVQVKVSANNGLSYQTVDRDELATISATGKSIKVQLILSGTAQIDSLKIQYDTQ